MKKHQTTNFISLLLLLLIGNLCMAQSHKEKTNKGIVHQTSSSAFSTTDLVDKWNEAWNKSDSSAIVSLMDNDVQFISGKTLIDGKVDVSKKFVSRNYKLLQDLKTTKIKSFTNGNLAYETGRYAHHIKRNNSIVEGSYSFVWHQLPNQQWKLKVVEIEEWPSGK